MSRNYEPCAAHKGSCQHRNGLLRRLHYETTVVMVMDGDARHFCIFFGSVILTTYGDARSASQNAAGRSA